MGKTTTFIMLRASRSEKERHVITAKPSMTEFHNGVGWELFEKLVAGDVDKVQARLLRSQLLFKYRPMPGDVN